MARRLLEAICDEDIPRARDIINDEAYGCIDSQTAIRDGTALFFCCCRGYLELVILLINKNANVNASNKCFATPLHAAADNNHLKIVRLLLDHGSNINAQTHRGDTPLHLAAFRGHADVAQLLVDRGADYLMVNEANVTAAVQATIQGNTEVAQYLNAVNELNDTLPCQTTSHSLPLMGLVDIRPPSPTASPIPHTSLTQSFSLPPNLASCHNYSESTLTPNEHLKQRKGQRLSKTAPVLTNFTNQQQDTKLSYHLNNPSHHNLDEASFISQRPLSTQNYQPVNNVPLHLHQDNNQNIRNEVTELLKLKNTFETNDSTPFNLSLRPPPYTELTPDDSTSFKCYDDFTNKKHFYPSLTKDLNFSNTSTNNLSFNIRPVSRQSALTTTLYDSEAKLEHPYLSMRSREPEESIDYSMLDLPQTASHQPHSNVKSSHESQIKHLNITPISTNLWKDEVNNEISTHLPQETNKANYHQTGSNHSSLMSIGSGPHSVLSNVSDMSCHSSDHDTRRGDIDFLAGSIPCYQVDPPQTRSLSINKQFSQHSPTFSSNNEQSYKHNSLVPPRHLSRLPSTPCSLDLDGVNFDLNGGGVGSREPSPNLRAISPMSLEPTSPSDPISGSRFMETSTNPNFSGRRSSDWAFNAKNYQIPKHSIYRNDITNPEVCSEQHPHNTTNSKQEENITLENRKMKLNFPVCSNRSRYNFSHKPSEGFTESDRNSDSSQNIYSDRCVKKVVSAPQNAQNRMQEYEGLNSMDKVAVSLNDLSSVTPKKQNKSGNFSMNILNIPV